MKHIVSFAEAFHQKLKIDLIVNIINEWKIWAFWCMDKNISIELTSFRVVMTYFILIISWSE